MKLAEKILNTMKEGKEDKEIVSLFTSQLNKWDEAFGGRISDLLDIDKEDKLFDLISDLRDETVSKIEKIVKRL